MLNNMNEELTHDSGKEFHAQAASNTPSIHDLNQMYDAYDKAGIKKTLPEVLAEFVCDELEQGRFKCHTSRSVVGLGACSVYLGITAEEYDKWKQICFEEAVRNAVNAELYKRGLDTDFRFWNDNLDPYRWYSVPNAPALIFEDLPYRAEMMGKPLEHKPWWDKKDKLDKQAQDFERDLPF